MTGKLFRFTRYLAFRIIFPIVITWVVLGLAMNYYVNGLVYDFISMSIEEDMTWLSREVQNICNSSLDTMIKSGKSGDEINTKIIQNRAMLEIEDLLRHYYADGMLTDMNKDLLLTTELPVTSDELYSAYMPEQLNSIIINEKMYYFSYVSFDPWNWSIYILKPAGSYDRIKDELQNVYLIIAALLLLAMAVIIYLIYLAVSLPIKNIIFDLRDGKKPEYTGAYEIEFLSKSIHEMMDSLESLNRDLEKRVEIRTRELADAKELAEDATKAKSQFLARMSHEIRTPMNAIIGLTNIVLKGQLLEEQRNQLTKVVSSSMHLLEIINDILDFSRVESGKTELMIHQFSLRDLMDRIISMFRLKAIDGEIEFFYIIDSDVPINLKGDSTKLGQILINLIGNAVKFTEQGFIIVKVFLKKELEQQNDEVWLGFSVKDSGVGIAEDKQDELFEPFTQLDNSMSRRHEGTGLGLSITRSFVNLMGGEIELKSRVGEGSEFTFHARFQISDWNRDYVIFRADEFSGKRVLVIDDSSISCEIFREILESMGFTVITETDPISALSDYATETVGSGIAFDLVIADWNMPGINGFELINRIRSEYPSGNNDSAFFVITTIYDGSEKFRDELIKDNAVHGIIYKPLNSFEVANSIHRIFGREKSKKEIIVRDDNTSRNKKFYDYGRSRILLVEDNEINRDVAVIILESYGFQVEVAFNGEDAIKKIREALSEDESYYKAVLMDIQMPVMDGYEATRIIRNDRTMNHLKVIAMTANALDEDKRKCLESGMNDYVSKPIDENELISKLARYINIDNEGNDVVAEQSVQRKVNGNLLLNSEKALILFNGNSSLYYSILEKFISQNGSFYENLLNLKNNVAYDKMALEVHSLKGASGNIGAEKLFNTVTSFESKLLNNRDNLNDDDYRGLGEVIENTVAEINRFQFSRKEEIPDTKSEFKELDYGRMLEHLSELEVYLKSNDSRVVKSFISFKKSVNAVLFQEEVEKMEEYIYNLDTEKALGVVSRIKNDLEVKRQG